MGLNKEVSMTRRFLGWYFSSFILEGVLGDLGRWGRMEVSIIFIYLNPLLQWRFARLYFILFLGKGQGQGSKGPALKAGRLVFLR